MYGCADRIDMSQRERDVLKIMAVVLRGDRTQAEAARLLGRSVRQVRRIQRRLEKEGDGGVVHRLRGRSSNHRLGAELRRKVLREYRCQLVGFGPKLASEKLAEWSLEVSRETLRHWLLAEGLWARQRRRPVHRSRRPRRSCLGELVQLDASWHDWTEGRGEAMVLLAMIDDATSRVEALFSDSETVAGYFELLERWLRRHGRPLALYSDRDSIFQWQSKGRAAEGVTEFGRALEELDIRLILANSPQAKGRVERLFGTAQDRWVKEMRLAKVMNRQQANRLLHGKLLPHFNRCFTVKPAQGQDAHRDLGARFDLAAILSWQSERVVTNDYTVRYENDWYQLHKPALPGLRGGRVIIEKRRDGRIAIRFRGKYLSHHRIAEAGMAETVATAAARAVEVAATPLGLRPRSVAATSTARSTPYRPSPDHPWRRGLPKKG